MGEKGMPSPGEVFDGRYEIVRPLGSGGMGVVYEAIHTKLRRRVAIKVLQREFGAVREYKLRFEREARASALLRSGHAVRVFDVGTTADELTYLVMELLDGNDLSQELARRSPLPTHVVVDWIVQACAALQEAHDARIIHRDIKPANIFIANEGGERVAKLVDFGISKFDESVTSALTKPGGGVLGTPAYMSPEQIRARRLDGRTDIWSLGVVLYRAFTGRFPFEASGEGAYLAAVIADPPVALELLRPDLPQGLASVIMRAIEKDRADRWPSARALAEALAPFGSGKVPLPARVSEPEIGLAPTDQSPAVPSGPGERTEEALPSVDVEFTKPVGGARPAAPATVVDRPRREEPPGPATPVPATPVPATPVPATPVPATPVPATPKRSHVGLLVLAGMALLGFATGAYVLGASSATKTGSSPTTTSSSVAAPVVTTEPAPSSSQPVIEARPLPTGVASSEAPSTSATVVATSRPGATARPPLRPTTPPSPSASSTGTLPDYL